MCRYVTSRDGYLVANGFVVHGRLQDHPLVHPSADAWDMEIAEEQRDIALSHLGLSLSRVTPSSLGAAVALRQEIAVTVVRLGLLAQALDISYRHLEGRRSFGQKVLHHQLVKARFAYAHELIVRLLEEVSLVLNGDAAQCAENTQALISEQFTQVSKLMGGHGYLLGGVNAVEYLSSMICAVYAGHFVAPMAAASPRFDTFMRTAAAVGGEL
jgi:hypothetical protein